MTQASWLGGITAKSPGPNPVSCLSSMRIFIRPDMKYPVCGGWQLPVCAIGLTCLDHCRPGWNVARPAGPASVLMSSSLAVPASNMRVSCGVSRLLRIIPAIAATPQGMMRFMVP